MRALLILHGLAGMIGLLALPIPLIARKGGRAHRRAGWVFAIAMGIVAVTAWIVCAIRLFEGDPRRRVSAIFLGYIGLLAFSAQWGGLRALRYKRRDSVHRHPVDLAIPALLLISGIGVFVLGLRAGPGGVILQAFSVVGILTGWGDLQYWRKAPDDRMHWWFQHMGGMIGTAISAVTAFLVVNAATWGPKDMRITMAVWLAPSAIGVPAIFIWAAYYRRKFSGSKSASPRVEPEGNNSEGGEE